MPYLIDGHNLIAHLPDISLDDPDDEAKLVQKLSGFCARTAKKCVVVFDTGLPGGKSRMSTNTVEVVFASTPAIADKILIERIKKTRDPKNWTVVSSDQMVIDAAQLASMAVIRSGAFAPELQIKPKPKKDDDEKPPMDVYVSPKEVSEWLKIFGDVQPKPKKKGKLNHQDTKNTEGKPEKKTEKPPGRQDKKKK